MARSHYRLTLSDALLAHEQALLFGGRPGIASEHVIESALGRPYSGYYTHIWEKSAVALHGVVSNHGFVDGNKRTALVLTLLLIRRSSYSLEVEPDFPMDDLVVDVATGRMPLPN